MYDFTTTIFNINLFHNKFYQILIFLQHMLIMYVIFYVDFNFSYDDKKNFNLLLIVIRLVSKKADSFIYGLRNYYHIDLLREKMKID